MVPHKGGTVTGHLVPAASDRGAVPLIHDVTDHGRFLWTVTHSNPLVSRRPQAYLLQRVVVAQHAGAESVAEPPATGPTVRRTRSAQTIQHLDVILGQHFDFPDGLR